MKKNIEITICFLLVILSSLSSFAQTDSIRYHDGTFETQYGMSGAVPGNDYLQCVVRFTPTSYPAQLIGIRAYLRNSGAPAPFDIVVYNDTAADALGPPANSQVYISPLPFTNPADGGTTDSTYSEYIDLSYADITIAAGDIYAGVMQYSSLNGFIGAAIDDIYSLPAEDDRQWISTSQGVAGSWYKMINRAFIEGHWGVTAYFQSVATGLENISTDEVSIYPNPSQDEVYLSLSMNFDKNNVELFDLTGRKIFAPYEIINSKTISIDVSKLRNGIYYCRIFSPKGLPQTSNVLTSAKIVVER